MVVTVKAKERAMEGPQYSSVSKGNRRDAICNLRIRSFPYELKEAS